MTRTEELAARWSAVMMSNYGTPPVALVRGEGATVWDVDGREYIDLLGGIATTPRPRAPGGRRGDHRPGRQLGHVSNLSMHEPACTLAERLLALAGRPGRVFFCNSGAEANEAAFKITRLTGRDRGGRRRGRLPRPDHGRAGPHRPAGKAAAVRAAARRRAVRALRRRRRAGRRRSPTRPRWCCSSRCWGRAACCPRPPGYLAAAASAAATAGALLALDEVQTGIGRTGSLVRAPGRRRRPRRHHPGQGARRRAADRRAPSPSATPPTCSAAGAHGSTFGGNPVAAAAALAVLDTIRDEGLLERAKELEHRFTAGIEGARPPGLSGVRGRGALLGIVLTADVAGALEARCAPRASSSTPSRPACSGSRRRSSSPTRRSTPSSPPCPPPSTRRMETTVTRHFLRDDDLSPAEQAEVLTWPPR